MKLPSLTTSLFEPYRKKLNYLSDERLMAQIVNSEAKYKNWINVDRRWTRCYGRFYPGETVWARTVFESLAEENLPQKICVLECFEQESVNPVDDGAYDKLLGWIRIKQFPNDDYLPYLPDVLSNVKPGIPTIVRYHPDKRCTIRVDYSDGRPSEFAKVFSTNDGLRIYHESEMLWQASKVGRITMSVSQPIRWAAETNTLWQLEIPAKPIKHLLTADGIALAYKIGCAAGSLPVSGLKINNLFGQQQQMERSLKEGGDLCRRIPALSGAFEFIIETLNKIHADFTGSTLVPIHRAPYPSQWLVGENNLGLIDFDGLSMGDPELDIASFISEVDFENPVKLQCVSINKAFLAGYESVLGREIDLRLLAAYCVHKRISKAAKYAAAIHPNGDVRAEQTLGRVLCSLLSLR